jgi:uncharacterized protein (UPF0332 family)
MGRGRAMTFEECLKKSRIKEFSQGKALVLKELKTAEQDLIDGKEGFKREKYKWTTIQSYYAMFHSARALLYNNNYREKSHHCLIVALRKLYVDSGKLSAYFIEALQKGKALREDADYYGDWSKVGSNEMLKLAEEFLDKAKELVHIEHE